MFQTLKNIYIIIIIINKSDSFLSVVYITLTVSICPRKSKGGKDRKRP
jgi:hypothetical protein